MKNKRLFAAALLALLALLALPAAQARFMCLMVVNPVLPPAGFGVSDSAANSSGYYPFDLATSPQANWGLVAYGNPASEAYLTPFTSAIAGGVQTYSSASSGTAAQGMTVALARNLTTNLVTQTISQTGVASAGCTNSGGSIEYDLFIEANAPGATGDPAYPKAYLAGPTVPTLDKLTGINISGTATMVAQSATATPGPCVINQSQMLYALVFNNTVSGQTLFYQLAFNFFCSAGTNADYNSYCAATIPSMNYFFTGSGGVWGIDDPINNYVNSATSAPYSLLQTSTPLDVEINFLPRVAYLIANGQDGLDTNLSHWTWGTFYYGQHSWGAASMTSAWSSQNLAPTIVYAESP